MYPSRKAKQRGLNSLNYYYGRDRKKSDEVNESASKSKDCVICLEKVQVQGALKGCDHCFCFICIYEWSKRTNSCPLCKTKFRCITKRSLDFTGSPPKTFRVKDKEQSFQENESQIQDDYDVAMGLYSVSGTSADDENDSDYDNSVLEEPANISRATTRSQNRVLGSELPLNLRRSNRVNDPYNELPLRSQLAAQENISFSDDSDEDTSSDDSNNGYEESSPKLVSASRRRNFDNDVSESDDDNSDVSPFECTVKTREKLNLNSDFSSSGSEVQNSKAKTHKPKINVKNSNDSCQSKRRSERIKCKTSNKVSDNQHSSDSELEECGRAVGVDRWMRRRKQTTQTKDSTKASGSSSSASHPLPVSNGWIDLSNKNKCSASSMRERRQRPMRQATKQRHNRIETCDDSDSNIDSHPGMSTNRFCLKSKESKTQKIRKSNISESDDDRSDVGETCVLNMKEDQTILYTNESASAKNTATMDCSIVSSKLSDKGNSPAHSEHRPDGSEIDFTITPYEEDAILKNSTKQKSVTRLSRSAKAKAFVVIEQCSKNENEIKEILGHDFSSSEDEYKPNQRVMPRNIVRRKKCLNISSQMKRVLDEYLTSSSSESYSEEESVNHSNSESLSPVLFESTSKTSNSSTFETAFVNLSDRVKEVDSVVMSGETVDKCELSGSSAEDKKDQDSITNTKKPRKFSHLILKTGTDSSSDDDKTLANIEKNKKKSLLGKNKNTRMNGHNKSNEVSLQSELVKESLPNIMNKGYSVSIGENLKRVKRVRKISISESSTDDDLTLADIIEKNKKDSTVEITEGSKALDTNAHNKSNDLLLQSELVKESLPNVMNKGYSVSIGENLKRVKRVRRISISDFSTDDDVAPDNVVDQENLSITDKNKRLLNPTYPTQNKENIDFDDSVNSVSSSTNKSPSCVRWRSKTNRDAPVITTPTLVKVDEVVKKGQNVNKTCKQNIRNAGKRFKFRRVTSDAKVEAVIS